MKKAVLSFLLFVICAVALHAQDVIVLRKGVEVKGKVIEIGEREIKYKKAENLDGPMYTLSKSEVFMIKYENGSKETFSSSESSTPPTQENKERLKEAHERTDPRHERRIEERAERAPRERREREPRRQINLHDKAEKQITGGKIMLGVGIPVLAGGVTLMGIALDDMTGHSTNKYHIDDTPTLAGGIVATAAGTVLTIIGGVTWAKGVRNKGLASIDFKPKNNPALNRYNYQFTRQTIGAVRITF